MAGDPADVGRAPVDVVLLQVEHVARGQVRPDQVPAGRVLDALRLAGRARGVEQEEQVLGVHRLRRALGLGLRHRLVVPDVALVVPGHLVLGAPHDHHGVDEREALDARVDLLLELEHLAAAPGAVGGDDGGALAVGDAVAQRLRAEAAEHDRVRRADARAGEHGHRQLGDHRHVDRDAVALLDAARLEGVRELADGRVQLGVGQRDRVAGLALPDDRGLVGARLEVLVQADGGGVQLAPHEPLHEGLVRPVEHRVEVLHPRQLAGDPGPEGVGVVDRLAVHPLVLLRRGEPRLGAELVGRGEDARLVEDALDLGLGFGLGHGSAGAEARGGGRRARARAGPAV